MYVVASISRILSPQSRNCLAPAAFETSPQSHSGQVNIGTGTDSHLSRSAVANGLKRHFRLIGGHGLALG